jgi:hypothetical protein
MALVAAFPATRPGGAMDKPGYGSPDGSVEPNGEWTIEDRLRNQAIRNLRRRAAFKIHLLVYVLVNTLLIAIWAVVGIASGVWFPWWVFPLLGWGIRVALHGWTTYHADLLSEERIRAEMDRITHP